VSDLVTGIVALIAAIPAAVAGAYEAERERILAALDRAKAGLATVRPNAPTIDEAVRRRLDELQAWERAGAMTVERGIVCDGSVIPGTEWVLRDSDAWWSWDSPRDRPDLRTRHGKPATLLVGHWTAGHPRTGPTAGPRVVAAMRGRKREDGSPMDVSIHFVIGWDGLTWQTADLSVATVHVGRGVNDRSVGVECCWPGTAQQAERLGVDGIVERRIVRGRPVQCLRPSDELIASWTRLARALSTPIPGRLEIPRVTAKQGMPQSGAAEHMHAPTTKVDAAGYLMDALRADGWR
jgi:hypothetical protein